MMAVMGALRNIHGSGDEPQTLDNVNVGTVHGLRPEGADRAAKTVRRKLRAFTGRGNTAIGAAYRFFLRVPPFFLLAFFSVNSRTASSMVTSSGLTSLGRVALVLACLT